MKLAEYSFWYLFDHMYISIQNVIHFRDHTFFIHVLRNYIEHGIYDA